jgi:hypothetical protein
MSSSSRELYVACGERPDGRWDLIVIPPEGGRNEIRIVKPDFDMVEGMQIAARLRERVRDFPQGRLLSGRASSALHKAAQEDGTVRIHEGHLFAHARITATRLGLLASDQNGNPS